MCADQSDDSESKKMIKRSIHTVEQTCMNERDKTLIRRHISPLAASQYTSDSNLSIEQEEKHSRHIDRLRTLFRESQQKDGGLLKNLIASSAKPSKKSTHETEPCKSTTNKRSTALHFNQQALQPQILTVVSRRTQVLFPPQSPLTVQPELSRDF